jgi:hypothetical protein
MRVLPFDEHARRPVILNLPDISHARYFLWVGRVMKRGEKYLPAGAVKRHGGIGSDFNLSGDNLYMIRRNPRMMQTRTSPSVYCT